MTELAIPEREDQCTFFNRMLSMWQDPVTASRQAHRASKDPGATGILVNTVLDPNVRVSLTLEPSMFDTLSVKWNYSEESVATVHDLVERATTQKVVNVLESLADTDRFHAIEVVPEKTTYVPPTYGEVGDFAKKWDKLFKTEEAYESKLYSRKLRRREIARHPLRFARNLIKKMSKLRFASLIFPISWIVLAATILFEKMVVS